MTYHPALWEQRLTSWSGYEKRRLSKGGSRTGEVIGFSNEGSDLAEDYIRTMLLLKEKPFPGRYDVPKLGLHDATLDEIITAIHRHLVLGKGAVEYPTAEEKERPLPTVAEEPTDFDLG